MHARPHTQRNSKCDYVYGGHDFIIFYHILLQPAEKHTAGIQNRDAVYNTLSIIFFQYIFLAKRLLRHKYGYYNYIIAVVIPHKVGCYNHMIMVVTTL